MASSKRSRLAERLHSIAIHVLRHARESDRESGLGPARLSALSVLVYGGPSALVELATAEQVQPPTMTRIVQGLEQDGLVRRQQSGEDRRSVVLHATRKGREVLERARQRRLARIEALLENADARDLARVDEALSRVFPAFS